MTEIKALFAIKHMKNDGLPMEIIPNLYLGSIGAAFSKKNLQDAGITHILCVADQIKSAYPDVKSHSRNISHILVGFCIQEDCHSR